MKFRFLRLLHVRLLAHVACNGNTKENDNNQRDGQANDTNTVEPTRYNAEDRDNTRNNTRNYTMDRDRDYEGREQRGLNREDRDNTRDNDRYDIAEEAADRISDEVNGIDRAYVLTTDNNAY